MRDFARSSGKRSSESWRVEAPAFQKIAQGLEAPGANADQIANGGVPQELHQWFDDAPGLARDGALQRSDFLYLCQAWRDDAGHGCGCCPEERPIPPPCHSPQPFREGHQQQDVHFRRSVGVGRHKDARIGGSGGGLGKGENSAGRGRSQPVEFQGRAVSEGLESMCTSAGSERHSSFALPESAWRSFKRPSSEAEIDPVYSEAGEMGHRHQRAHLRQAREAAAAPQHHWQRAESLWREDPKRFPKMVPRILLPDPSALEEAPGRPFQGLKFLSLFGGVGNPAKCWKDLGGIAFLFDLSDSTGNDLSKHSAWNTVERNLKLFHVVGIDLPCNTWSRARRAPWWSRMPKPLRSTQGFIMGLPGLSATDFAKVKQANVMFLRAVGLIKRCLKSNIAGYLENPANSMLWDTPQIQRLLTDSRVHLCVTDMCMYGTAWRKPTKLLLWNVSPSEFLRCRGHGKCQRTGKAHLQLSGISGKKFLTEQAQVYSRQFSHTLMLTFKHPSPLPPMSHAEVWVRDVGLNTHTGQATEPQNAFVQFFLAKGCSIHWAISRATDCYCSVF